MSYFITHYFPLFLRTLMKLIVAVAKFISYFVRRRFLIFAKQSDGVILLDLYLFFSFKEQQKQYNIIS